MGIEQPPCEHGFLSVAETARIPVTHHNTVILQSLQGLSDREFEPSCAAGVNLIIHCPTFLGLRHLSCKARASVESGPHAVAPAANFQALLSNIASPCTEDDGDPFNGPNFDNDVDGSLASKAIMT